MLTADPANFRRFFLFEPPVPPTIGSATVSEADSNAVSSGEASAAKT